MKLEDIDKDILTQGDTYTPTNELNESDAESDKNETQRAGSGNKMPNMGTGLKALIIIIVIIIVALLAIVGVSQIKKTEDKRAEELLAQLEEEDPPYTYTSEEIKALRANGYTGDEIEQMELDEQPFDRMIDDAVAERKDVNDKEIKPYLDGASDEFKELQKYTWMYGDEIIYDVTKYDELWVRKQATINMDYDKVPPRGVQCFLRLVLSKGNEGIGPVYVFMMVDPIRYAEIPETGNIVVNVEYYLTDVGTVVIGLEEKVVADK